MGSCWSYSECYDVIWWVRDLLMQSFNTKWGILGWAIALAFAVLGSFHASMCIGGQVMYGQRALEVAHVGPGYGAYNGPHTWNTATNNQSPINIDTANVQLISLGLPLMWNRYDKLPLGIRLENNGHTLLLRAAYDGAVPCLDGADLLSSFNFVEISFRWCWHSINNGSEHTLNNRHFPLEMQCLHTDSTNPGRASSRSLLVVSYLFEMSVENPFLSVIVQYLIAIQYAGQCVEIPPFPLRYLMPPFYTEFYSYQGSLTEPPCHRGAEWFINPLPLAIGEQQLHEFRNLRSHSGSRIGRNIRPVQELGDRTVNFNRYSRE